MNRQLVCAKILQSFSTFAILRTDHLNDIYSKRNALIFGREIGSYTAIPRSSEGEISGRYLFQFRLCLPVIRTKEIAQTGFEQNTDLVLSLVKISGNILLIIEDQLCLFSIDEELCHEESALFQRNYTLLDSIIEIVALQRNASLKEGITVLIVL